MAAQPMTPREAANVMEGLRTMYDLTARDDLALSTLVDHARATSGVCEPAPEGGDVAARIVQAIGDPGVIVGHRKWGSDERLVDWQTRAVLAVLAPAPSVATPPQEGEARAGETECWTCCQTVDVYMAPVTEAHEWGPNDGPGSENPRTLCPGSNVDHGDVARLDALRDATPAPAVTTAEPTDGGA